MSSDAPNSIETIVCLANSRKISGRCVAGKRTGDNSWFRPISDRIGHEISELDRRYSDGKTAQLLDVIEIPCIEERPHGHQSENVLIDDRFYWEKGAHHGTTSLNWLTLLRTFGRTDSVPTTTATIAFQTDSSTKMAAPCA